MTIEQKAQRYDEALKRAKKLYEQGTITESLNYVFPELKESEDEKIRKAIHIYLDWLEGRKDYAPKGKYTIKDMISWLEKQGENLKQENYKTTICGKDYKCIKNYKVGNCSYSEGNLYHCGRDGYLTDDNGISWSCDVNWCKEYLNEL